LLGIGRNQYIELMNQHRSSRKLFRRKPPRELLPLKPVDILIEPWFVVQNGYITEEDVASLKPEERKLIDNLIDSGNQGLVGGTLNYQWVHNFYKKGLIYIDVPIEDDDYIVVPPLEGFVMNRVSIQDSEYSFLVNQFTVCETLLWIRFRCLEIILRLFYTKSLCQSMNTLQSVK
jgi:hypothetical protein